MKMIHIVLIASALYVCGCGEPPAMSFTREYSVLEIRTGSIDLESAYPATIRGRQDIDIFPKITGFIERVNVREGETVRKGQTLFTIEQVQYRAALQTAEANVEAAKAGVATAQLVYDSKKELFDRNVVSRFELSTAGNQWLTAKAQLAQAEAQAVDARNNLSYTLVKSPADGIVGTLPYREGSLVNPSMPKPLTTVSDNSDMYVYFSLAENQLLELMREYGNSERVLVEMPDVSLRLNDGSVYGKTGRIETISGIIDPTTGAVSMRAVFPNPDGLLRSGSSGNVTIPYSFTDCIIIPQNATVEVQDRIYVYKVVDGTAKQSQVTVSKISNGVDYIVEEGLRIGEIIVDEGVGLLQDGMPVSIKKQGEE